MPEILPAIVTHTTTQDGFGSSFIFEDTEGHGFWLEAHPGEVSANLAGSTGGIRFTGLPSARIFSATLRVTITGNTVTPPQLGSTLIFAVEQGVNSGSLSTIGKSGNQNGQSSQITFNSRADSRAFDGFTTVNGLDTGNLPQNMNVVEVARIGQAEIGLSSGSEFEFDLPLPPLFSGLGRATGSINFTVSLVANPDDPGPFFTTTIRDIEHGFAAELDLSQLVTDDGDSISFRKRGHRWFVCIRCGHEYPIDRAVRDAEQRTLFVCDTGCQDELGRRDTLLLRRERQDRLWPRI